MGYYKNATICINGHVASSSTADSVSYCGDCGVQTMSHCQNCDEPIRGDYEAQGIVMLGFTYHKPSYCVYCGGAFPWTQTILDNAIELISLDDNLHNKQKEIIKNAFPDLVVETPTTPVAVAKYKKHMPTAATYVQEGVRNLLIDVVSETVKKTIWG